MPCATRTKVADDLARLRCEAAAAAGEWPEAGRRRSAMARKRQKAARPIDPVDVAASVTGGVVMLDGLVDETNAREVLEQIALEVPEVGDERRRHASAADSDR